MLEKFTPDKEYLKCIELYDSCETKIELTSVVKNVSIVAQYWNDGMYKVQVLPKRKEQCNMYILRIGKRGSYYNIVPYGWNSNSLQEFEHKIQMDKYYRRLKCQAKKQTAK